MQTEITTWHLELTDRQDFRLSRPSPELRIERAKIPCPELNRFLYTAVGGDLYWIDRLSWTWGQWMAYLDRPEVETWIGSVSGTPAGYFELERQAEGSIEIAYFGLLPQFVGRGLGGALLSAAVERGWETGARRVWLHTCSLDHAAALPAYQARGFRIFRTEAAVRDLPERPPGPWPGAGRIK
ncbi:MAG TPA: GNAT family N-acetyltransferase [Thermoanaerobaculia bacterium]|nr:GNAT family N-acetyltransferase [Thermoanaerobaculia bacterium]